jgi:hypothetical protein
MPENMHHVVALIPATSPFSLKSAVDHFGSKSFRGMRLRSQLAKAEGDNSFTGFRVWYGDWSVVCWLDAAPGVLADSQHLVEEEPLPAPAEVIVSCLSRLSVLSDADPDGDRSDEITHFTDDLRKRFGLFIYDPVNGGWWT